MPQTDLSKPPFSAKYKTHNVLISLVVKYRLLITAVAVVLSILAFSIPENQYVKLIIIIITTYVQLAALTVFPRQLPKLIRNFIFAIILLIFALLAIKELERKPENNYAILLPLTIYATVFFNLSIYEKAKFINLFNSRIPILKILIFTVSLCIMLPFVFLVFLPYKSEDDLASDLIFYGAPVLVLFVSYLSIAPKLIHNYKLSNWWIGSLILSFSWATIYINYNLLVASIVLFVAFLFISEQFLDLYVQAVLQFDTAPLFVSSRHGYVIRQWMKRPRHDFIRRNLSPTLRHNSISNWIKDYLRAKSVFRRFNYLELGIIFSIIVIPLLEILRIYLSNLSEGASPTDWQHVPRQFWREIDIWQLASLGAFTLVLYVLFFIMMWIIRSQSKHIILPFVVMSNESSALVSISPSLTNEFAEQLQHISMLLQVRQVENANTENTEISFSNIVASGQDNELLDTLQNAEIETSGARLPFGSILYTLSRMMARTQIKGSIQYHPNRSIEIGIEYSSRTGHSAYVKAIIPPRANAVDLSENQIEDVAHELAIKLAMKLGHGSHVATSWESFAHFIDGLDASQNHQWWHAIYHYRQSIQIEESYRGVFGLGYYHLGAALIYQGEIREGLTHLNIADKSGLPLPETQYMIALAVYYLYGDEILKKKEKYREIQKRCEVALSIRADFAEARHLLGTLYFRMANKHHQEWNGATNQDYEQDYYNAIQHLWAAIRLYDRRIKLSFGQTSTNGSIEGLRKRLMLDRLSATHHLADSLRLLNYHWIALEFYRDILVGLSGHVRTLIDMGKNYCQQENWRQAYAFLRYGVFARHNLMSAYWDPSVSLYMGWIYAGGITAEAQHSGLNQWEANLNIYPEEFLREALAHLDYAIVMSPSHFKSWDKNKWRKALQDAIQSIRAYRVEHPDINSAPEESFSLKIKGNAKFADRIEAWLYLRLVNYSQDISDYPHLIDLQNHDLFKYQARYVEARYKGAVIIYEIKRRGLFEGVGSIIVRDEYVKILNDLWVDILEEFTNNFEEGNTPILNLHERWLVDLFANIAMLYLQFLAETRLYSIGHDVATELSTQLDKWRTRWQEKFSGDNIQRRQLQGGRIGHKFSYKIFDYQLASAYAWRAYMHFMMLQDPVCQILQPNAEFEIKNEDWNRIFQYTQDALDIYNEHPLALFTRAKLHANRQNYLHSNEWLQRLLAITPPADPQAHVAAWETRQKHPSKTNSEASQEEAKSLFDLLNNVSGFEQYSSILDKTLIHMEIAHNHRQMSDWSGRIRHLQQAIVWTAYQDVDARNFMQIADSLDTLNRPKEALGLIAEVKKRVHSIDQYILFHTDFYRLNVLECRIYSRNEFYEAALNTAKTAQDLPPIATLIEQYRAKLKSMKHLGASQEIATDILEKAFKLVESKSYEETTHYKAVFESKDHKLPNISEDYILWVYLSVCAVNSEWLKTFSGGLPDDDLSEIDKMIRIQMVSYLLRDIWYRLYEYCELKNKFAYNWSELNLNLAEALEAVDEAIFLMTIVYENVRDTSIEYPTEQKYELKRTLAYYYDTQGWILYHQGKYEQARTALEKALIFMPDIYFAQYHLARVYQTMLERVWQKLDHSQPQAVIEKADEVREWLSASSAHWRHTQHFDNTKRMSSRLAHLQQIVEHYRKEWQIYQSPSLLLKDKDSQNKEAQK